MPDRQPAPYRYWGSVKPPEQRDPIRAQVEPTTSGATATIRLYDPIDSWGGVWGVSAKEFASALDALPDNVDTIELRVNSPGGESFEGVTILNALRNHDAKVVAIVDGLAASAASFIAAGADECVMGQGAQMMIHKSWGLVVGNSDVMHDFAAVLDKINQGMAEVYQAKAGGDLADWMTAMAAETWYTADEAVAAGLADRVAAKDTATASARFDLSIFAHAGRDHAPEPFMPAARAGSQTPAEPPEKHTHPKEAVSMTPDEIKALRERLGLADDADLSAINAKLDELEEAATTPTGPAEVTDEQALAALAKATGVAPETVKAAVDGAKAGKVTVSQTFLDELTENAKLGAQARAKQLEEERDDAIEAAFRAGKISAARRDTWRAAWDKDPEGTKSDLDSLEARFPVGQSKGYAGSDETDGEGTKPFTDNEAETLASLTGTKKEALLHE